ESFEEAFSLHQKAGAKGFYLAQYALGAYYDQGYGNVVPQNSEEALKWYKEAASELPLAREVFDAKGLYFQYLNFACLKLSLQKMEKGGSLYPNNETTATIAKAATAAPA